VNICFVQDHQLCILQHQQLLLDSCLAACQALLHQQQILVLSFAESPARQLSLPDQAGRCDGAALEVRLLGDAGGCLVVF
jgi:hypothetical protein